MNLLPDTERPAEAYTSAPIPRRDDSELHITFTSLYPQALCGAIVTDRFDPYRVDTAGRDRCSKCLAELARMRRRGDQ